MVEAEVIKYELITEALQLGIALLLLRHTFIESRINERKRILFLAFVSFVLYLVLHMFMRAIQAGYILPLYPEIISLFSHTFKTMFFMIFGYAAFDALISEPLVRRILHSSTISAFLILLVISTGIIAIEGWNLNFNDTIKELVYELIEMSAQVMIINIIYQSWKETRSANLLVTGASFLLFFLADFTHAYSLMWGYTRIEFIARHVVRLLALALLAYALIYYEEKSLRAG